MIVYFKTDTANSTAMGHIEFLGPPGVGKSTLHRKLVSSDNLYGGIRQRGIRRQFFAESDRKYQLAYRALPPFVRSYFDNNFFYYYYRHTSFAEFVRQHPTYIELIARSMDAVAYEEDEVFRKLRESAEYYQVGINTVDERETLCLDISFAHRAASVLWRLEDNDFSLEEYFERVPLPDLLVHVHAPDEVCIERQQKRGRIAVNKPWDDITLAEGQAEWRNLCFEVSDYLSSLTDVVVVENTKPVNAVVSDIERQIVARA